MSGFQTIVTANIYSTEFIQKKIAEFKLTHRA